MTTFAGTWNITMDTPIGTIPAVLEISENDGVITGTAQSKDEKVDFNDAVGDGDRLTWSQVVTTPMKLTLKFDVTVDGDSMNGTAKAGMFPASKVTGSRSAT